MSTKEAEGEWVEYYITYGIKGLFRVKKWIYKGRSDFQNIEIFEHDTLGICMLLDSVIQLAEYDEYIYHEMLVHPAMLSHPSPKRVLLLGGGDGCALREVLKHPVEEVVLVDIDQKIVEVSSQYLARLNQGAFEDPRVQIVIEDGRKYVSEYCGDPFDVIISDLTDPLGPSALLYTKEFYSTLERLLARPGCLVVQAQSIDYYKKIHASVYLTLRSVFKYTAVYAVPVLSFSMIWAFVLASNDLDFSAIKPRIIEKRIKERGLCLKYFDPRKYQLARLTVELVADEVYQEGRILTDDHPISIKELK